ncbi:MAG TPA: hypothetical protein DET40_11985 [Lentisphaeria bacterium]|nr:MAG: hypothetical protein A2X45_16730 [Lentisphaerae bacterium GWF2_50_93]HCE44259.1 hypothetical protein [Lentisphaeria bacterium]
MTVNAAEGSCKLGFINLVLFVVKLARAVPESGTEAMALLTTDRRPVHHSFPATADTPAGIFIDSLFATALPRQLSITGV